MVPSTGRITEEETIVITGWIQPTVVTDAGSRPTSSCASRSAAAVASSPSSSRPPGKLTSPWCVRKPADAPGEDHAGLTALLEERRQDAGVDVERPRRGRPR